MEEERESRPTGHRFWPVVCIHLHSDMWRYMYITWNHGDGAKQMWQSGIMCGII